MTLTLFNTPQRGKKPFKPLNPPDVSLYTCGPTVYNYAHIGNLRTYIFEDILRRVLTYNGFRVTHVMNITDVGHLTSDADTGEDKIQKGAQREGKSAWDVAAFYTNAFQEDMERLNILEPTIWCKATDHITEQINLIKKLEEKGFTYRIDDGIYFDTSKFPRYADFAHLNIEGLKEGARVELVEGRKHPTDFALWKFSPKGQQREMEWNSPWGKGFPGWHIECSAMSMKYLGETFDIHAGGIDHIPVHHTNEIAQSEAATGKPLAHYWLHGEYLIIQEGKMAKSGENFLTLQTLIDKGFDPLSYRYYCLQAHYRQKLNFTWEALEAAQTALNRLREKIYNIRPNINDDPSLQSDQPKAKISGNPSLQRFEEAINDDLNMPQALAVLWDLVRSEASTQEKIGAIDQMDRVFGLQLLQWSEPIILVPHDVQQLMNDREIARKSKDWAKADELRLKIHQKGFDVEDTSAGPVITKT